MLDKCTLYHGRFVDCCFHDRQDNVFLMINLITCSLKPSLQRGFLKPEAQNIYVRYLKVFTLDKNGEEN